MLLCEIQNYNRSDLLKLAQSVDNWCSNYSDSSVTDRKRIQRSMKLFQYGGKMYRTVFVVDRGNLYDDMVENIRNDYRRGKGLSSWSRTIQGMEKWKAQTPETLYFPRGVEAIHEVICVQRSVGFDVEKFYKFLTSQQDLNFGEFDLMNMKYAADVQEIIALYSDDLRAYTEDIYYKND